MLKMKTQISKNRLRILYLILIATSLFFLLGFSADKNDLKGQWECNADKTMENLDTLQLSDMEEQYYYNYFQGVSLEVTEKEMISEQKGIKDKTTYEVLEQDNNKIIVYYPEEDENDSFVFLDDNTMKWSLETKKGEIEVFFDKQQ